MMLKLFNKAKHFITPYLFIKRIKKLLPGGRPASDRTAAVDLGAAWGVDRLPTEPGLDGDAMLAAAASGALQALVVAGLQPTDLADSDAARDAFEKVGFLEIGRAHV